MGTLLTAYLVNLITYGLLDTDETQADHDYLMGSREQQSALC